MKKVISSMLIAAAVMVQANAAELIDSALEKSVMSKIINKSYGDFAKRSIVNANIIGDTANVTVSVMDPTKPYPEQVEKFVPNVKLAAQTSIETWKYQKIDNQWVYTGSIK